MSKSLGNFFTVRDLLDQGVRGEVIRFVFLSTHYRKPMDWTAEKAKEAEATLRKWYAAVDGVAPGTVPAAVLEPVADDLNVHGALTAMHELYRAKDVEGLAAALTLLGFLDGGVPLWAKESPVDAGVKELVDTLVAERTAARKAKDFARADALRDGFARAGVIVKDTPEGAVWELATDFDPAALEGLR